MRTEPEPAALARKDHSLLALRARGRMLFSSRSPRMLSLDISRREWLRAGALTPFGLMLPDLVHQRSQAARARHRAKSCIVVFLFGAPAHQDIWDLKPAAPSEVRGEFSPIASSVPGIALGEHVPRI